MITLPAHCRFPLLTSSLMMLVLWLIVGPVPVHAAAPTPNVDMAIAQNGGSDSATPNHPLRDLAETTPSITDDPDKHHNAHHHCTNGVATADGLYPDTLHNIHTVELSAASDQRPSAPPLYLLTERFRL